MPNIDIDPINAPSSHVDSRDIALHLAYYRYLRAPKRSEVARVALDALNKEIAARETADKLFHSLAVTASASAGFIDHESMFSAPAHVKCGSCCEYADQAIAKFCGGYTDYSLQYRKVVVNACNAMPTGVEANMNMIASIKNVCEQI